MEVSAEADVVFAVTPGAGFGECEGLGEAIVRLLLIDAGELVEDKVRQAVVERIGVERGVVGAEDADLGGDVFDIGEEVAQLRVVAVPGEGEIVGQLALADGVSGRERVAVGLLLAAELVEDVDVVAGRVAVVEVGVDALVQAGAGIDELAGDGGDVSGRWAEAVVPADAEVVGVGA